MGKEKGPAKDICGMVGRKGERTGAGPEYMHARQRIAGPRAGEKEFKEKAIGVIQYPNQQGRENQGHPHFFPAKDKKEDPG